jgi:hypothetical protein
MFVLLLDARSEEVVFYSEVGNFSHYKDFASVFGYVAWPLPFSEFLKTVATDDTVEFV